MAQPQLAPDYGAEYGDFDHDQAEDKTHRAIKYRSGTAPNRARARRQRSRNRTASSPVYGITHRRNHRWSW